MKRLFITIIIALLAGTVQAQAPEVPGQQQPEEETPRNPGGRKKDVPVVGTARIGLGTNAADWAFLGTANINAQLAVGQHWTVEAEARWNPWTYNKTQENQLQYRQKTFAAGLRWWPWYSYSGWWVSGKLQYQEYNRGGIGTMETEEGDAVGLVAGVGYSLQLLPWLNLDFGATGWLGGTKYTTYACPYCGRKTGEGDKFFILPNQLYIAAFFIF